MMSSADWSHAQQKALEAAMRSYPAMSADRWSKIAAEVPGKRKRDCVARVRTIATALRHTPNKKDHALEQSPHGTRASAGAHLTAEVEHSTHVNSNPAEVDDLAFAWEKEALHVSCACPSVVAEELTVREGGGWRCLYTGSMCQSVLRLKNGHPVFSEIGFEYQQVWHHVKCRDLSSTNCV